MSEYFPVNQSAASTRWLTEEVFKLIDLVQKDEAIYNTRHKYYFCRPYVENFWREVDHKLDKNPGASLAKWTNLRISFRREFTNYLEEQVPPCWSYFDRMFFLHPYLRKKQHQQPLRQGEPNLQETLAQISELSNRLERRVVKETIKSPSSVESIQQTTKDSLQDTNTNNGHQAVPSTDHYFDYYDETEPNNSEVDEIIDDDQHLEVNARYPHVILETNPLHNEIKSECEDEVQEDDYERFLESRHEDDHKIGRVDEVPTRNSIGTTSSSRLGKRSQQQMRLEHLNRLQTRLYHEDLRAKRSRSPERLIGNAQAITTSTSAASQSSQRLFCTTSGTSAHSSTNVSFVRPTLAISNIGVEAANSTTTAVSNQAAQQQTRHTMLHHNLRSDGVASATSNSTSSSSAVGNNANSQATRQLISPTLASAAATPHLELCDCKTDPDAMFLMSLLPDIQKLNGRDRGKIKIAFQNILQDYLYPD